MHGALEHVIIGVLLSLVLEEVELSFIILAHVLLWCIFSSAKLIAKARQVKTSRTIKKTRTVVALLTSCPLCNFLSFFTRIFPLFEFPSKLVSSCFVNRYPTSVMTPQFFCRHRQGYYKLQKRRLFDVSGKSTLQNSLNDRNVLLWAAENIFNQPSLTHLLIYQWLIIDRSTSFVVWHKM